MFKSIQGVLDKIPHWVLAGIVLFFGALYNQIASTPSLLSALSTWNWTTIVGDLKVAAIAAFWVLIGYLKTDPWTTQAQKLAAKAANAAKLILPVAFMLLLSGSSSACKATIPAPPPGLPGDLETELTCVLDEVTSGVVDVPSIAQKCTGGTLQVAIDLLDWLFSSVGFATDHQAAASRIIPQLLSFKKDGHL